MFKPLSLTTDPILQLTWRIALPASVGMFFNTLFNFIDTYFAGLLGTEALAALSLSFPLFFLIIAVGSGLSQGTTALLANSLGAGKSGDARHIFAQSLIFAIFVGILLSLAGLAGSPMVFRQLGAGASYLTTALSYMNVIFAGGVFMVVSMAMNSALSAQGETRVYRNFLIVGCLTNALLNPVLMWGWFGLPALGVAGIALSTILVQIGGCLYLGWRVHLSPAFQSLPTRLFRPDKIILKQIMGQSVPSALNMITIALGVFVITWFVKEFGKEAVAATGIATRIEQLVLMPVIGVGTAMLSITGQNHGCGLPHRVREAWRINIQIGVSLMIVGSLLVGFFGKQVMRIFTDDPLVIHHGSDYLTASAFTLAAYPVLFVTVFMMQGLKRPAYGLWIGIYRQVLAPIAVMHTLVFTLGWGLQGVWWGFCLVTWSAAFIALFWGWRMTRIASPPLAEKISSGGVDLKTKANRSSSPTRHS